MFLCFDSRAKQASLSSLTSRAELQTSHNELSWLDIQPSHNWITELISNIVSSKASHIVRNTDIVPLDQHDIITKDAFRLAWS